MSNEDWAKAIIIHLTGKPDLPTPTLLKMIGDIRAEGALPRTEGYQPRGQLTENPKPPSGGSSAQTAKDKQ